MSAVQDVYDFLLAQGLAGGSTEWGLVRRRIADSPQLANQAVVVTEDGGYPPEIPSSVGIGDSAMKDIGVQVLVRGEPWDGDGSLAKAVEIYDALHGKRRITLGSVEYLRVVAQTPEPVFLGFDETGRPRHTTSYLLLVEVMTS